MSMALDTALAINYLLVNVRSWIAFLTSALSLIWKIKSSSSIHKDSPSPPPHDHQSSPPPPPDHHHHQRSLPKPPPQRQSSAEVLAVSGRLESRRSGKFRVVYLQGEDNKQLEAADSTGAAMIRLMKGRERSWGRRNTDIVEDGWEGLLKLKTADMGWYRYQDLTLFNGNVVQLWQAPNHFNLPTTL